MSEIAAADIYKVIEIVGKDWLNFARTKLGLTEVEIEECQYGARNNLREERFQMVQTWKRNEGSRATTSILYQMAKKEAPAREHHQQQPQDCQDKYTENPPSSNSHAAPMTCPQDDVPNRRGILDTDKLKPKNNSPTVRLRKNTGNSDSKAGTSRDVVPTATGTSKTFGENTPEKQHKRTESGSSHSVTSELGSLESVAKPKKTGKLTGILKKFSLKGNKSKRDNKPTGDNNETATERLCDSVHWGRVNPVTEMDLEKISQDSNHYPTETNRGCVLILNNSFMTDKDQKREGSDKDVENMEKLWHQIGCDIYRDAAQQEKTAQQMIDLMREMTVLKVEYSYIVVVIMTHGGSVNGSVILKGSDNCDVSVTEIETIFNNKNAHQLINVPKFFIFQFCCGTKVDRGVKTDSYEKIHRTFKRMASVDIPKHEVVQTDGGNVPTSSDMHFAYATHKDHAALRSPTHGSWFITAITNVFKEYSRSEDVNHLLLRVNGVMKNKFGVYEDEDKKTWYRVKAMSWNGGSFTKRLFLLPGYHNR